MRKDVLLAPHTNRTKARLSMTLQLVLHSLWVHTGAVEMPQHQQAGDCTAFHAWKARGAGEWHEIRDSPTSSPSWTGRGQAYSLNGFTCLCESCERALESQ